MNSDDIPSSGVHEWSQEDLEKLSDEHRRVFLALGTLRPPIGQYPHIVCRNTPTALRQIIQVLNCSIGVWGDRPLVDSHGRPYVEPADSKVIDEFVLFELPQNQEYALRRQAYGKHGFSVVISARTPPSVIDRMWRPFEGLDELPYYQGINQLPQWIDSLGWAYVPLEYEYDYALFVMAKAYTECLNSIRAAMAAANEDVWHIECSDTDGRCRIVPG